MTQTETKKDSDKFRLIPHKKRSEPGLSPQIKGFGNSGEDNLLKELSSDRKTAKNHMTILYVLYKAGNDFIHPKTAYCLKEKGMIKEEPDGSYSLDSAGTRFIKRVLELKGEEYIEPQKELMVTITEEIYSRLNEQNRSHRQAMRMAHDYAVCGDMGMVIKALDEELGKW